MAEYIVKRRRQFYGKIYERGDTIQIATEPQDLSPEWLAYFEPKTATSSEKTPVRKRVTATLASPETPPAAE